MALLCRYHKGIIIIIIGARMIDRNDLSAAVGNFDQIYNFLSLCHCCCMMLAKQEQCAVRLNANSPLVLLQRKRARAHAHAVFS
jgi:hypothetical protein